MTEGHCLCGQITYTLSADIEFVDHCHCSMCRRSHGAAFATYGRVARSALELKSGSEHLKTYASSDSVNRKFCAHCGSNLFFEHAAMPDHAFVTIGSLADSRSIRVDAHIFVGSKSDWFEILDALPQHEDYPPT